MSKQTEILDDQFVAYKVRFRIGQTKITQRAIAKELQVSEFYISRRVQGDVPFSAVELAKVAKLLDVELAYFFPPAPRERAS